MLARLLNVATSQRCRLVVLGEPRGYDRGCE